MKDHIVQLCGTLAFGFPSASTIASREWGVEESRGRGYFKKMSSLCQDLSLKHIVLFAPFASAPSSLPADR